MKELLFKKLVDNNVLVIGNDLQEAFDLAHQKFYTSAFLHQWRIVESVSRELILSNRIFSETRKTLKKIQVSQSCHHCGICQAMGGIDVTSQ